MAIRYTEESIITIENYEEQYQRVQKAIASALENGQQYQIVGSRQKTAVAYSDLIKERTRLERILQGLRGKTPGRNYADNSGYYNSQDEPLISD